MRDTAGPAANSRQFGSFSEITSFIWSVADLLRGDYKQADYGKVILPFTVLRRLDCVLADTREAVWKKNEALKGSGIKEPEEILNRASKVGFHNVSKFDFSKLKGDPNHLAAKSPRKSPDRVAQRGGAPSSGSLPNVPEAK